MQPTSLKVTVIVFSLLMIILSGPLGRLTAKWQRMVGLGTAANESFNRVGFIVVGALFLIVVLLAP